MVITQQAVKKNEIYTIDLNKKSCSIIITFYCSSRALLSHLEFHFQDFFTLSAFCATLALLDTTRQEKQTFSSSGERPVTVE